MARTPARRSRLKMYGAQGGGVLMIESGMLVFPFNEVEHTCIHPKTDEKILLAEVGR